MKINTINLHNFRSVEEQAFHLGNYSLLIGANNSGKTNIIDALRIFYEKNLKFLATRDFPKFETSDKESWIEIKFELTEDEFDSLKEEYKQKGNVLSVRKYMQSSDKTRVRPNQSNIYGYEGGVLSENLFYGAKNISEAKLGDVVYIPEVAKVQEYTKLSGPSPFRDSLDFVVRKVMKTSPSFEALSKSFREFNTRFKTESSEDGISIDKFVNDLNVQIEDWRVSLGVDINEIKPQVMLKNLVSYYFQEEELGDEELDIGSFGQGLQRHLIYTLIRLSTKYRDIPKKKEKKEFSPNLILILFEEPEAFLHPAQQEILDSSLREVGSEDGQQVVVSTHSSHFVSRNVHDIRSLLKLTKTGPQTILYQLSSKGLENLLSENKQLKEILGEDATEKDLELESIRYSLWLDPDRCCSFFADTVLICEGLSEKALLDLLMKSHRISIKDRKIYVLNAGGKHNIHRYMNLFGELGIKHGVLYDGDGDSGRHRKINEFIDGNKNEHTLGSFSFDIDLEDFLGIQEREKDKYRKPLNVMWHYRKGKIEPERIDKLAGVVTGLTGPTAPR